MGHVLLACRLRPEDGPRENGLQLNYWLFLVIIIRILGRVHVCMWVGVEVVCA